MPLIIPDNIFHGLGAFSQLSSVSGRRAFIVVGKGEMLRSGYIEKAIYYLRCNNQVSVKVFEGVEINPSIETVMEGFNAMMRFQPDLIIGLGGGGVIDAAKAMWVFYEHPYLKFNDIIQPFTVNFLRKKARFVAIPSTSAVTHVTCVSVITDRRNGVRYPLVSYELCPDVAIIDGVLSRSMPPHITANTALGALAHAIEAYISPVSNIYTDYLAERAIIDIFKELPIVFENGNNLKSRQRMHDASCLAGAAFCNTLFGIIHSLAFQVGSRFGVPYGRANAIILPNFIRFSETLAAHKCINLVSLLKERDIEDVAIRIERLCRSVCIESSFSELGISRDEWFKQIPIMAELAMQDACSVHHSGRTASLDEVNNLLAECF
ncbi:iron-containing alcohol dehydrogenase [Yersinia enterocolitica]|uniref:iron-containing alcohol dehydrogenase n=1 Tax=Yersinia enterocolitica TaxID=630 RepID=UPI0005DF3DD2|nr:iron-containing alcohol dehydrogenase [Yersinia enterocolitica]MBW5835495.1 iron-containing alcohol dehydrogenase [Yersinia enterocolitica]CNL75311.1 aldehyde-alcohol dehydrogenase [Yersinia enterocolitica]